MDTLVLEVPAMYADHHVVEVRRILLEDPGVDSVDASSAFHVVEVRFEPDRTSADALQKLLDEAGYLGELPVPLESGQPAIGGNGDGVTYFRHSTAREIAGASLGFDQEIASPGLPLWPCPGFDRTTQKEQMTEG